MPFQSPSGAALSHLLNVRPVDTSSKQDIIYQIFAHAVKGASEKFFIMFSRLMLEGITANLVSSHRPQYSGL